MHYSLLAADMDGTLLNSRKEIAPGDADALNRALDAGKTVIFCTGRCIAELEQFFGRFPRMRYMLGESGALVYDLQQRRALLRQSLEPETVQAIMDNVVTRDIMPQVLMQDAAVMNLRDIANLAHFRMAHYQHHFDTTGRLVEEVYDECAKAHWVSDKICLYHTSPEEREVSRSLFQSLPVTLADAEETSLEISPRGVDKGKGLRFLCGCLGIPVEETIAVGDSYNDLSVLNTAGLAVAVGNAVEDVKAVCGAVVADHDHCGVAEAVDRFLLK